MCDYDNGFRLTLHGVNPHSIHSAHVEFRKSNLTGVSLIQCSLALIYNRGFNQQVYPLGDNTSFSPTPPTHLTLLHVLYLVSINVPDQYFLSKSNEFFPENETYHYLLFILTRLLGIGGQKVALHASSVLGGGFTRHL